MATITQDIHFRLSLIRYAEKHGVTKAALTYHVNRQYIYCRKNRFDGSPDSLRYRSGKPHSHRKDNEGFYATHSFYSFEDFATQLQRYNRRHYNHFLMHP